MASFLNAEGLTVLWNRIKGNFVSNTKKASDSELGLVKIGDNVNIADDGTISVPITTAYELAVENGFEGTEAQWLNSLIGPQGQKGDTGDTVIIGDEGTYTLYGSTGQNIDGAMTQKAVSDILSTMIIPISQEDYDALEESGSYVNGALYVIAED